MYLHAWIFVIIYAWTASKIHEIIKLKEHTEEYEYVPGESAKEIQLLILQGFFLTESEKNNYVDLERVL